MEYKIKGFDAYMVTEERQIIKITETPKGKKVKIISAIRPNPNSEYEYVKLTKKENGKTKRYCFAVDEIFVSAKLGLELGTPESREKMKQYRRERDFFGKIELVIGDHNKEKEIINSIHVDLIRQMKNVGLNIDVGSFIVYVVAQTLFDYFRICIEASKTPVTYIQKTKNGEKIMEHPIWQMKREFYDDTMKGLYHIGLTYEKVIKELPPQIFSDLNALAEEKEKQRKAKNLGITWVDDN